MISQVSNSKDIRPNFSQQENGIQAAQYTEHTSEEVICDRIILLEMKKRISQNSMMHTWSKFSWHSLGFSKAKCPVPDLGNSFPTCIDANPGREMEKTNEAGKFH